MVSIWSYSRISAEGSTACRSVYGVVPGRVVAVSRDAVRDEALGLVYPARIVLDRATIAVGGADLPLGAGMTVTAEIKTDSRRLIEYLLSPILRYQQESLGER